MRNPEFGEARIPSKLLAVVSSPEVRSSDRTESLLANLLARIATQDRPALGEFYDATKNYAFGLALRMVSDRATAEEVTLDAYQQVWRDAGRFDAERGKALSWLLLIVRSRSIDALRSKAHRVRQQESAFDPAVHDREASSQTPEELLGVAARAELVRRALDDLDADKRRAIALAFFGGLTHAEVSQRLGLPLGTVKTRIRSAMQQLRDALSPLEGSI